ncbi:response regulator [Clostridia bacterium]|nr:response regulator [Clostridia bacterium]
METALLVSPKTTPAILEIFQSRFSQVFEAVSADAARDILNSRAIELCAVNAPLPDEFGDRLAKDAAKTGITQVVMFARETLTIPGVMILPKPPSRAELLRALDWVKITRAKLRLFERERSEILQKLEELRVVARAKLVLVERLGLSESEAHRHVEKQAMDMRKSREQVAQMILRTYEN